MSIGLDPDQDPCAVGLDLVSNYLQGLSADDKSPLARKELTKSEGSTFFISGKWGKYINKSKCTLPTYI